MQIFSLEDAIGAPFNGIILWGWNLALGNWSDFIDSKVH